MSSVDPQQLGSASFRVLESFDRAATGVMAPLRKDVRMRLANALPYFPELSGETVTVARLDPDDVESGTKGRAGCLNRIVYLPTNRVTTYVTLFHELGHLAIEVRDERGEDVPTSSEEFCSIFSMARMPTQYVDEDRVPYLGKPGRVRGRFPTICQHALDYREENGANSHYIKRCEEWLRIGEPKPEKGEARAATEPAATDGGRR